MATQVLQFDYILSLESLQSSKENDVEDTLAYTEYEFGELYKNYSAALYGIILRVVKYEEVAEDALQDTFVKIWKNIEQYDAGKGRLFTWMANLAKHTAIDYVRSKNYINYAKTDNIEIACDHQLNQHHTSFNQDGIGLDKLIRTLNPEQQQIVKLFYYGGYTHTEMADRLQMPLGTVKTKLRQAICKLRVFFDDKSN